MKNSQKGTALAILIVIITALAIGGGIYVYENKKISITEPPKVLTEQSSTAIKSASYDLMGGILTTLNVKNVNLVNASIEWSTGKYETPGGRRIKETYSGYSFVVAHSPADNERILQTWKSTGEVDELDIATRFERELKNRGFLSDQNNSGDGTFNSSSGFSKGNLVCIVKHKITTPSAQVDDSTGRYSSVTTVICADKSDK